jgi:hypothetical protein
MKKSLLVPALALTMAGTVLFATQTFAQGTNDPQTSLVQKIAEKFNLNKDDVQKVFDEERNNRESGMQKQMESRLTQAVQDGKITEEQKKLILDKVSSLHASRTAEMDKMKSMTADQRKEAMKTHKDELKTWADQNGIDLKSILGEMGPRMHRAEK